MLRNRAAGGDLSPEGRADIKLRLKLLLGHARIAGLIVDRKQVARMNVNLGRINRADLDSLIERDLELLAPGARARLRRIAAGTLAEADSL